MVYGAMQGSSSETDHHPAHLKLFDEAQGNKLNAVSISLPAWRNPGPLEANFSYYKERKHLSYLPFVTFLLSQTNCC